jgi:hypothetical protein
MISRKRSPSRSRTFEVLETRVLMSATADAFENDDTWNLARSISPNEPAQVRSIHTPTDVDWAKFDLSQGARVTIETDGPSGDTRLWLCGPNDASRQIAYDDDGGNGSFSRISAYLEPGTYYACVDEYGQNATIASYTLRVQVTSVLADAFEPDDTATKAHTIGTDGAAQLHSLHTPADVDWLKFEIQNRTEIVLATNGSAGDTEMWLYGPSRTTRQIAYDDDGGAGDFSRIVTTLERGTYYVKICESGQNDAIDSYRVSLTTYALADLQAVSATAQPSEHLTLGSTTSIEWLVRNMGPGTADPSHQGEADWTDRIYLSADKKLGDDVTLDWWTYSGAPLSMNDEYHGSRNITLPTDYRWAGKSAYILVQVDGYDDVYETRSTNNVLAIPVTIDPNIELLSPVYEQFVDARNPIELRWLAFDARSRSVVDMALDSDNDPTNGVDRWLVKGRRIAKTDTPQVLSTVLAGLVPRAEPYYVWARIRRSGNAGQFYSEVIPVYAVDVAACSEDALGDTDGGSGYEVFGVDAGQRDQTMYFRVRTNYNADSSGGGDIDLKLGSQRFGLALHTRTLADGSRVVAGDLYGGVTFSGGTLHPEVPSFIKSYTTHVAGKSEVLVVPTPDAPWRYEILGNFELSALTGLQQNTPIDIGWSMSCGNDTDEADIEPDYDVKVVKLTAEEDVSMSDVANVIWTKTASSDYLPVADSLVTTSGGAPSACRFHVMPTVEYSGSSTTYPVIAYEWSIAGTSSKGQGQFQGTQGDITVTGPTQTGTFTLDVTFSFYDQTGQALAASQSMSHPLYILYAPPIDKTLAEKAVVERAAESGATAKAPSEHGTLKKIMEWIWGESNYRYSDDSKTRKSNAEEEALSLIKKEKLQGNCYSFAAVWTVLAGSNGIRGSMTDYDIGRKFITVDKSTADKALSLLTTRESGNAYQSPSGQDDRWVFDRHAFGVYQGHYYDPMFNNDWTGKKDAFVWKNLKYQKSLRLYYSDDYKVTVDLDVSRSVQGLHVYSYIALTDPSPPAPHTSGSAVVTDIFRSLSTDARREEYSTRSLPTMSSVLEPATIAHTLPLLLFDDRVPTIADELPWEQSRVSRACDASRASLDFNPLRPVAVEYALTSGECGR